MFRLLRHAALDHVAGLLIGFWLLGPPGLAVGPIVLVALHLTSAINRPRHAPPPLGRRARR